MAKLIKTKRQHDGVTTLQIVATSPDEKDLLRNLYNMCEHGPESVFLSGGNVITPVYLEIGVRPKHLPLPTTTRETIEEDLRLCQEAQERLDNYYKQLVAAAAETTALAARIWSKKGH